MVFPLFLAALLWDRLPAGVTRWRLPALRIGGRQVRWSNLVAGVMFIAIAATALYLAVTGQMSYSPGWLTAWNRWATGVAGDLAATLRQLPVIVQGLALIILAVSLALLLYGRPRWHRKDEKMAAAASSPAALDRRSESI